MVSLEKNDRVMLARQLPLKSAALILAGGRGPRLKDLTNKRASLPCTLAVSSALSILLYPTALTPGSAVLA